MGHFSVELMFRDLWHQRILVAWHAKGLQCQVQSCIDCLDSTFRKKDFILFNPLKQISHGITFKSILVGPIPKSNEGYTFVMTTVDVMTGFAIFQPLKDKTMEESARVLWQLISTFGPPKILQSDNGLEFVNQLMNALVQLFGIDRRLITAYNPRCRWTG